MTLNPKPGRQQGRLSDLNLRFRALRTRVVAFVTCNYAYLCTYIYVHIHTPTMETPAKLLNKAPIHITGAEGHHVPSGATSVKARVGHILQTLRCCQTVPSGFFGVCRGVEGDLPGILRSD